jgi:spore coat protein U-like protein
MSSRLRGRFALALAGAAVCGVAGIAFAGTSTTTFDVTATVLAVCDVTASDLAFGNYDPNSGTPNDASTTLSVTCSNGETYDIALDEGAGTGATVAARLMMNGANTLSFGLFTNAGRTTSWGDGTLGTSTVAGTGNGAAQSISVYGRIPIGQLVASGAYTDTITVTLTY